MSLFLGIDTSAYTTSVALVNEEGQVMADERMILQVEVGKRGLRQAEAHFNHVKNLPFLFQKLKKYWGEERLLAVAASDRPRRRDDSYMPVFLAGMSLACCLASVEDIPVYGFSHQEGHVRAALINGPVMDVPFIVVHFSGGTSEILVVERDKARFDIRPILTTNDLNAGQLVDRVGVALGLPFPSGPHLEEIARRGKETGEVLPSVVGETSFSFSGAETRALRMLHQGIAQENVAFLVFRCIANTLEKALRKAYAKTGIYNIIMAGGVMSSLIIRERLDRRLAGSGLKIHWASGRLSSDNAVGIASLARDSFLFENEG